LKIPAASCYETGSCQGKNFFFSARRMSVIFKSYE
jgi:hypothetical protein